MNKCIACKCGNVGELQGERLRRIKKRNLRRNLCRSIQVAYGKRAECKSSVIKEQKFHQLVHQAALFTVTKVIEQRLLHYFILFAVF